MKGYKFVLFVLLALALLALVPVAVAQDDGEAVEEPAVVVIEPAPYEESVAWGILQNLLIAGFPVAGLGMLVVQLIKQVGARLLGEEKMDGMSGYVAVVVACVLIAIAIVTELTGTQTGASQILRDAERIVQAMLAFGASVGWFKVARTAQIF